MSTRMSRETLTQACGEHYMGNQWKRPPSCSVSHNAPLLVDHQIHAYLVRCGHDVIWILMVPKTSMTPASSGTFNTHRRHSNTKGRSSCPLPRDLHCRSTRARKVCHLIAASHKKAGSLQPSIGGRASGVGRAPSPTSTTWWRRKISLTLETPNPHPCQVIPQSGIESCHLNL